MRILPFVVLSLLTIGCSSEPDSDPFGGGGGSSPTPSSTPLQADGQEVEPNDSLSQANTFTLGESLSAAMGPGDVDYFKLLIPDEFTGEKITLTAFDHDGLCFEGTDPNMEVFSEAGESLAFVEDSYAHYCPIVNILVQPGDVYTLKIGTGYILSGPYVLSATGGGPGSISGTLVAGSKQTTDDALRGKIAPGEVLIQGRPGLDVAAMEQKVKGLFPKARRIQSVMGGRYQHFSLPLPPNVWDHSTVREWTLAQLKRVRDLPWVVAAEPNGVFEPFGTTPNDPGYGDQWHYQGFPGVNLPDAWSINQGLEEVVVAVIDSGYDSSHDDLKDKRSGGYDFISNIDSAGDGDGVDSDAYDSQGGGHGTHVAGTIAADTDNGVGVSGVGWNVSYMPLRVCGGFGCTEADITNAIYYAAGYAVHDLPGLEVPRAEVINMSLGGHDLCSNLLQEAITAVEYRGVVVVVAAGNDAGDASEYSPASCEGVIAVASTTEQNGALSGFSNYGDTVDIAAPGSGILSTYHGNAYAILSGTSMASPHVAGAVALVKSINPFLDYQGIQGLMMDSAASLACGSRSCGAGLLDVAALLALAEVSPNDVRPEVVLVEAVSESGVQYFTVPTGPDFYIGGLEPGTYTIRVGIEVDGDLQLSEAELSSESEQTYVITSAGEDHEGVDASRP